MYAKVYFVSRDLALVPFSRQEIAAGSSTYLTNTNSAPETLVLVQNLNLTVVPQERTNDRTNDESPRPARTRANCLVPFETHSSYGNELSSVRVPAINPRRAVAAYGDVGEPAQRPLIAIA